MDYYTTMATVVPLVYVALALEGRVRTPLLEKEIPYFYQGYDVMFRVIARLIVFVGLPLIEAGLLIGIERGHRIDVVDANAPLVLAVAALVLVCPPIWDQIKPFVPKRLRKPVATWLEWIVGFVALAELLLDPFDWLH